MQKAVLHRKEATAEEFRFFRLWLVVALHINNWFSGPILIYGCGHWLLVFGMLVAVSLGCSVAMEAIKDFIHYRTWMEKVGNNFCNKQKLWYNNYEREMKEL